MLEVYTIDYFSQIIHFKNICRTVQSEYFMKKTLTIASINAHGHCIGDHWNVLVEIDFFSSPFSEEIVNL